MTAHDELLALERKFWTSDAEFYRNNLDDHCLVAFREMAGVMSKDDIAQMVRRDAPRWRDLEFDEKGFVEPADGVALLSYHASGRRESDDRYEAVVSSLYVKRDGRWKLAFHQQTPLEPDKDVSRDSARSSMAARPN